MAVYQDLSSVYFVVNSHFTTTLMKKLRKLMSLKKLQKVETMGVIMFESQARDIHV